jgi:uncharacterized membrane protein YjjP (DUF1212 family)
MDVSRSSQNPDALGTEPHADAAEATGAGFLASQAFVMELGRALLRMGTPAHRLEEAMTLVSRKLGMEGEFYSTPTALIATFAGKPFPRTHLVRSDPGDVHLEKLVLLDELTDQVVRGTIPREEGAAKVKEVLAAPDRYGSLSTGASYGLSSASLAFVFGGGWREASIAGIIGLFVGALAIHGKTSPLFDRVLELLAAFFASFFAHVAARVLGQGTIYLTTVTGLIVLIPGLMLTVALTELSTFNWVSGTARLVGAGVIFLKLAFGVALGGRLGALLFGPARAEGMSSLPDWAGAPFLLSASLAFTVLYQARPRDAGWILLAGLVAFLGARAGAILLGPELGPCLGAFLVTGGSNLYARVLRRPGRVLLVPSILFLVPGSIGFQSVSFLLEEDVFSGVSHAFRMALAGIALVAGVLFANLLIPPRRLLG